MDQKMFNQRKYLRAMIVGCSALVASAVVVTVFATRDTQTENAGKVDFTQQAAIRILDCTNPEGKCTKKNQRQTAVLIKSLINADSRNAAKAASAAAYCANTGLDSYPEILACVLDKMNER